MIVYQINPSFRRTNRVYGAHPKMELLHNIPLSWKKIVGKTSLVPLMGVHPNPIVNEMNLEVPLAKTATKPQTFKPLYPELRLTQEKASN